MKNFFCTIGILVGVAMVLFGMYTAFGNSFRGETTSYMRFGADFYTEMYSVTKDVVEDINKLGVAIVRTFGMFISFVGMATICLFASKMGEEKEIKVMVPEAKPAQVVVEKEEKKEDLLPTI